MKECIHLRSEGVAWLWPRQNPHPQDGISTKLFQLNCWNLSCMWFLSHLHISKRKWVTKSAAPRPPGEVASKTYPIQLNPTIFSFLVIVLDREKWLGTLTGPCNPLEALKLIKMLTLSFFLWHIMLSYKRTCHPKLLKNSCTSIPCFPLEDHRTCIFLFPTCFLHQTLLT